MVFGEGPAVCHALPEHAGASEGRSRPRTRFPKVELRTYIVEDNATIRENLVGTLEELASVVSLGWAETENEARSWLQTHDGQWDLAIIDLFLKQGSGLGVLEACQARGRGQRVVVLSNYATADMRKRCTQLGADAVFDKSNEIDALVDYCLALSEHPAAGT
jgi:two-component system OmpR family response regulator